MAEKAEGRVIVRFRIPKPLRLSQNMKEGDCYLGDNLRNPFFDNGAESLLTCHAILDQIALHDSASIRLNIDKEFLKMILHSHIHHIRSMAQDS